MKTYALLIMTLAFSTVCMAGTVDLDTNIVFDKADGVLKYRSPFDPETTLKLNTIVVQAKDSITKFDDEAGSIHKTVDAVAAGKTHARQKALKGLARLESLHAPVVKAKTEMVAARTELVASKRYFNNIVLSGMEGFINRVDDEFTSEIKGLSAKIKTN